MLLKKLYRQFHASSTSDERAVVDAKMKTPVRTVIPLSELVECKRQRYSRVEIDSVPLLPSSGSSTIQPASSAPGTPSTLSITCCGTVSMMASETL